VKQHYSDAAEEYMPTAKQVEELLPELKEYLVEVKG